MNIKLFNNVKLVLVVLLSLLLNCEKLPKVTIIKTGEATEIGHTFATLEGEFIDVSDNIQEYGFEITGGDTPYFKIIVEDDAKQGKFQKNISGLAPGKFYNYNAYAKDNRETIRAERKSFETFQISVPTVTSTSISNITQTTATSGGNVTVDGGASVTARGVVWSTSQNPSITFNLGITSNGTGTGSFASNLTSLNPNTTYYVRAYATNSAGTSYGNQIIFTSLQVLDGTTGSITDIDGNVYRTTYINGKEWMSENLKTTRYNDGTIIPTNLSINEWDSANFGAYTVYPHVQIEGLSSDGEVISAYGLLYNWYSTNTNKLCPVGWHVPNEDEIKALLAYAGPHTGRNLKSCKQINSPLGGSCITNFHPRWDYSDKFNVNGIDLYGFSAFPSGGRYSQNFYFIGKYFSMWTTHIYNENYAYRIMFSYDYSTNGYFETSKRDGFSIRCIKD